MKKSRPLALLASGPISGCSIARLPSVRERLGPVKAPSFRLASRIANSLREGYPVRDCEAFQDCGLILICSPPSLLPNAIAELAAGIGHWNGKVVLLGDCRRDSRTLRELAERGAAIGSLHSVEGLEEWFLVEGDENAVREGRKLIEHGGGKALKIRESAHPFYAASASFAGTVFVPLLEASRVALREAGLTPTQASSIVEGMFQKSLRAYLKGGRKVWKPPRDHQAVAAQLESLRQVDPKLADYLFESITLALELFDQDSQWLANNLASAKAATAGF